MADKVLMGLLAAHADNLNRGKADRKVYLKRAPDQREELEALLRLAEQIKRALVPVQPSPTFVKNLVRQLVVVDNEEPARGYRREVVIGAAAVGSALSVVGLIAYLVRSRARVKAPVASTG